MVKRLARTHLNGRIAKISDQQRQEKSLSACRQLCDTPEFGQAEVIMFFLSLPKEVNTSHAILRAFQMNKTVAVPSIVWDKRHLIPVVIHSIDCEMKSDRHGLRIPVNAEPMPITEIDFIVVPGLGFDHQGNRIGRGGGFYDRFLGGDGFTGVSAGLAFEEQVLDSVPTAEHDIRLDMLVTDQCIRRFGDHTTADPASKTAGKYNEQ